MSLNPPFEKRKYDFYRIQIRGIRRQKEEQCSCCVNKFLQLFIHVNLGIVQDDNGPG